MVIGWFHEVTLCLSDNDHLHCLFSIDVHQTILQIISNCIAHRSEQANAGGFVQIASFHCSLVIPGLPNDFSCDKLDDMTLAWSSITRSNGHVIVTVIAHTNSTECCHLGPLVSSLVQMSRNLSEKMHDSGKTFQMHGDEDLLSKDLVPISSVVCATKSCRITTFSRTIVFGKHRTTRLANGGLKRANDNARSCGIWGLRAEFWQLCSSSSNYLLPNFLRNEVSLRFVLITRRRPGHWPAACGRKLSKKIVSNWDQWSLSDWPMSTASNHRLAPSNQNWWCRRKSSTMEHGNSFHFGETFLTPPCKSRSKVQCLLWKRKEHLTIQDLCSSTPCSALWSTFAPSCIIIFFACRTRFFFPIQRKIENWHIHIVTWSLSSRSSTAGARTSSWILFSHNGKKQELLVCVCMCVCVCVCVWKRDRDTQRESVESNSVRRYVGSHFGDWSLQWKMGQW